MERNSKNYYIYYTRRYIIMDNDSGALILLIVLIASAFLLIVLKLAQFVNRFSREKQHLLTEMHRAADYNEYRYWRRELRCLYLCLIPFVTERNVMKVYPVFFHRAKHAAKKKRSDGLMHILAPSMLGNYHLNYPGHWLHDRCINSCRSWRFF